MSATALAFAAIAFAIGGQLDSAVVATVLSLVVVAVTAAYGRAAFTGSLPRPLRGAPLPLAMSLLALVSVLSIGWSVLPDSSYFDALRTIAYTAIVAGGVLAAQLLPGRARAVLAGIGIAAVAISLYALISRIEPQWFPSSDAYARLRMPFEYWNAVGAVAMFGVLAALWLGASREAPRWAVTASYPAGGVCLLALTLSQSRGAMLVTGVCLAVWLILAPRRLRSCGWLAACGVLALAATAWAYGTAAFGQDGVALAQRESTGRTFALVVVMMTAALAALGFAIETRRRARPLTPAARRNAGKVLLIALAISPVVLLAGIAFGTDRGLATIGDHYHDLVDPNLAGPANTPNRLTETSSVRARYWNDAFKVFADHHTHGTGGDTYSVARLAYRHDTLRVRHAHGFVPQAMSDFGTWGLLLAVALAVLWLAYALRVAGAAWRAPNRWLAGAGEERLATLGIMLVGLAFGLHSAVDWTWYVPGVATFGLFTAGWTAAAPLDRPAEAPAPQPTAIRVARAAGIALVGLAVAFAVYQPARAMRKIDEGFTKLAAGRPAQALAAGRDARGIDGTSANALFLIAAAQDTLGQKHAADATLLRAAGQQPGNPDTWIHLADFRLNVEQDALGTFAALKPLLFLSPNNERGNQMLAAAKKLRTQQLIKQELARQRAKLERELRRWRQQVKANGFAAAPATTP